MSDFKAKMHQIQFRLGLRPRPRWGAYSAPPDHLAGFKGSTSKGRDGRGRGEGGEGRVRKRKGEGGGKGKVGESVPLALILQFGHCPAPPLLQNSNVNPQWGVKYAIFLPK